MSRFKCDICNNEYELNFNTFKTRLIRDNINPCPFCKPINVKISEKERKFHQFIKNNYFGNIIENDYKELFSYVVAKSREELILCIHLSNRNLSDIDLTKESTNESVSHGSFPFKQSRLLLDTVWSIIVI